MSNEPTFHAAAKTSEVEEGEALEVTVGGKDIALYNVDGEFYATDAMCTHAFVSLADGYVEGDIIECPLHGGKFEIIQGRIELVTGRHRLRRR